MKSLRDFEGLMRVPPRRVALESPVSPDVIRYWVGQASGPCPTIEI
jgi:hypothetical protein